VTFLDDRRRDAAEREANWTRLCRLMAMDQADLRALLAGEPRDIAPWIAAAAGHGEPWAQLCLGQMRLDGAGVAVDPIQALTWFRRAAEAGLAEAMNMVGRCLENGWGTEPDLASAAHWYGRSARAGHDWGQYNYAHMLLDGRGAPRDAIQALHWYRQAAQQGHARAMNLLARCLEEGWGAPPDAEAAADWYRRSAEAGYFRGQFNHAAVLAAAGETVEARVWFERALTSAPAEARAGLAQALADHPHPDLARLGREEAPVA
jgi:TPR repeat protein